MDHHALQASHGIDQAARAIAEWTVDRHVAVDPGLSSRYGSSWRALWAGDVQARLHHLAQAIAVRRPALFVEAVRWMAAAFEAREVQHEDLVASLQSLREVYRSDLPTAAEEHAAPCLDAALEVLEREPPLDVPPVAGGGPHGTLTLEYLEALLSGERDRATNLVTDAAERGVAVTELLEQVLQPAQGELGRLWHLGEVTVAEEHYGTAITQSVMTMLRRYVAVVPRKPRRLAACSVSGDLHEVGVRMVSEFFEMDGWEAVYLGANVPGPDLLQVLADREIHLLALAAGSTLHLRTMGELIGAIRADEAFAGLKILVGGPPFAIVADLRQELGADAQAASATEAVNEGNRLVGGALTGQG